MLGDADTAFSRCPPDLFVDVQLIFPPFLTLIIHPSASAHLYELHLVTRLFDFNIILMYNQIIAIREK
jgi:hypothetical protein